MSCWHIDILCVAVSYTRFFTQTIVIYPLQRCRVRNVVKMVVCSCPAVVDLNIVRPDLKYQLGFTVQDGVVIWMYKLSIPLNLHELLVSLLVPLSCSPSSSPSLWERKDLGLRVIFNMYSVLFVLISVSVCKDGVNTSFPYKCGLVFTSCASSTN